MPDIARKEFGGGGEVERVGWNGVEWNAASGSSRVHAGLNICGIECASLGRIERQKIHLKAGKYILRVKGYITPLIPTTLTTIAKRYSFIQFNIRQPCIHYLDEFSRHIVLQL